MQLSCIHRIFNQKKLIITTKLPHFIEWKSQLVFTAIIVVLQLLIGTVWLIAEHPGVSEHIHNDFIDLQCQAIPILWFDSHLFLQLPPVDWWHLPCISHTEGAS